MSRPEHVHCIRDMHTDKPKKSWCGRELHMFEFAFLSIDHAALNGRLEGRMVACAECTAAIAKALTNGQEEA